RFPDRKIRLQHLPPPPHRPRLRPQNRPRLSTHLGPPHERRHRHHLRRKSRSQNHHHRPPTAGRRVFGKWPPPPDPRQRSQPGRLPPHGPERNLRHGFAGQPHPKIRVAGLITVPRASRPCCCKPHTADSS